MNLPHRAASPIACLLALLLYAVLTIGAPAAAAPAADAPEGTATAAEATGQLVRKLEDPAARQQLIADLKALQAAQRQAAGGTAAASPPPNTVTEVLRVLSDRFGQVGDFVSGLGHGIGNPERLMAWVHAQATEPARQALWIDVLVKLALVLGCGLIAGFVLRFGVARSAARLEERTATSDLQRLPLLAARLVLQMLPVLAFAAASFAALVAVVPGERVRLVLLAAIYGAIVANAALALVRFLFSPFAPGLRLFRCNDETAAYIYIWLRRLIGFGVYGYMALQAALLLGLPRSGYLVALKLLGLIILGMLVVLVLQNREAVAVWFRGRDPAGERLGMVRRRLAEVWHVLAVFYLIGLYSVWALQIEGGFEYLLRSSVMTVIVLLVYRLALAAARRVDHATLGVNKDLLRRYPFVGHRADRYLPPLRRLLQIGLQVVLGLAILAVWRVDVVRLLQNTGSQEVVGRLAGALLICGLALLAWEAASAAITLYLERRDGTGMTLVRSARMRTLLPLIRNALLVLISIMATLMVLSQLGLDIGPLLAGAGVVGLAIGFGAQALVKDVITGAFILFEDTVHIGDVAEINGIGGLVEGMTIRTIRMRDQAGTVHTVPFGSITGIANMTKDFSYYVVDMGVGYREDTDQVVAAMREAFADLAADPAFAPLIMGDLEVLGLDRFADSSVVIKVRIKTLPIKQWTVGREYNRRVKYKFDALGIDIPVPQQTIFFGQDRQGRATPLRVVQMPDLQTGAVPSPDELAAQAVGGQTGQPAPAPGVRSAVTDEPLGAATDAEPDNPGTAGTPRPPGNR